MESGKSAETGPSLGLIGPLLFVAAFALLFVVPLHLIYGVNREAARDWGRMLPAVFFGFMFWAVAMFFLIAGITFAVKAFSRNMEDVAMGILGGSTFLCPGVYIPYYWIKRIVVDHVPAFGYNPDNIYAIVGVDNFVRIPICLAVGWLVGFVLLLVAGLIYWAISAIWPAREECQ